MQILSASGHGTWSALIGLENLPSGLLMHLPLLENSSYHFIQKTHLDPKICSTMLQLVLTKCTQLMWNPILQKNLFMKKLISLGDITFTHNFPLPIPVEYSKEVILLLSKTLVLILSGKYSDRLDVVI